MGTDQHGLKKESVTREIIGCAIEVLNALGPGLLEKPYENALAIELGLRGITVQQQPRFRLMYKDFLVGEYIPDIIVDGVVVETKVIDQITDHELGQVLNYLKITGLEVGLILNFKQAKLTWKRLVL